MRCGILWSLPARAGFHMQGRPDLSILAVGTLACDSECLMVRKPKLAVWKFASCDGCQLTVLSCEDELLKLADQIEIAYFREASSAVVKGPYDLSLVEGSITTKHDAERIHKVRHRTRAS